MKRAAILMALALAPALGSELPAWRTSTRGGAAGRGRAGAAFVGTAGQASATSGACRAAVCGLRMQAQSATQDPPRFRDVQQQLTGVLTRAERHAMMIGSRSARTANIETGAGMAHSPALWQDTWETMPVGHGVRFNKRFDEHLGQPALQRAVDQIHQAALTAFSHPGSCQELVFSAEEVTHVRKVAYTSYMEGQRTMTKLGQLLAGRMMSSGYECRSLVTGESGADTEEFRLSQEVPLLLLDKNLGSFDLAQQQLSGLMVESPEGGEWRAGSIIDHGLEFEAKGANDMAVSRVIAHARPSAELWRFISDAVFDINCAGLPVENHHHDSMFEIKILAESPVQADLLHHDMRRLIFNDGELRQLQVPITTESRNVKLISQTSDARKSKVVWQGFDFSIQVQTLDEYYVESELSSMAVRAKEQACRERLCQELERRVSLFKFSRDLLHWLFASSSMRHPPSSERIVVKLRQ
jgi:hypothetical protein